MTKLSERHLLLELPGQKLPDQTYMMEETPALAGSGPHVTLKSPLQHLKHAILSSQVFQESPCRGTFGRKTPRLQSGGAFTSTCGLNSDSRSERSVSKQGPFFP